MFFHLFSENFQNVLGPCVSDTALILVNPVYKESRFSSEQTRIKLVPNSSVIPNNLFKMSSPTFCDVVAVRLLLDMMCDKENSLKREHVSKFHDTIIRLWKHTEFRTYSFFVPV